VRLEQQRYSEALSAFTEARDYFQRLSEPGSVAAMLHEIGRVHQAAGSADAAEDVYRESLGVLCESAIYPRRRVR
jgi:hypothetical protein